MPVCDLSSGPLSEELPSRKIPRQLPNFHSERLSIRCGRPGPRRLFRLVVFLLSASACADVFEQAALQIPDGSSQSKLRVSICLWISLGGRLPAENGPDKTPMEPSSGSGVCSGARKWSWLPSARSGSKPGLALCSHRESHPMEFKPTALGICQTKRNKECWHKIPSAPGFVELNCFSILQLA